MEEEQGMGQVRATAETTISNLENDTNNLIFRGRNSMIKNQPGSKVLSIGERHACVSLKEMVCLSKGFGAKFKFTKN